MTALCASIPTDLWTAPERRAWQPPEDIKPSDWAEKYRRLPRGQSARPGPWRNANAPYLRGIMDLCDVPGVVELNIMKATQIGVSEALRNVLGYIAHENPEPMGLALPDRDKGRKVVGNRVHPLFRDTPVLKRLLGDRAADTQSEQIRGANGFLLHLMWSGSASSMASDPMRVAICDEVDKFKEWTGKEADPVSLIEKRLSTYEDRRLQVNISTPTTRFGKIATLVEGSDVKL